MTSGQSLENRMLHKEISRVLFLINMNVITHLFF